MLNRRQSAAARQLLLTTYLLSVGGRAKDEKTLRERLPPYGSIYGASLKEKGDEKTAAAAVRMQIVRDMDALANAGVDVEVEASRVYDEDGVTERRHYRLPSDGFSPVELDFSEGERAVLVNALRSAGRGFAFSAPLYLALVNLVGLVEGDGGTIASSKSSREDEAISKRVAALEKAISRRKRARFDYESTSGEISTCEIEPYILSLLDGTWYATGRSPEDGSVSQFKVSRIRSRIVNANTKDRPDFERPKNFNRLFAGPQAPWQLGKTGEWAHILLTSSEAARRLMRSFRWAGTFGRHGGHRTFMTRYSDERALAGWTLSLGDGAKVLAPEPVVEEVVAGLEKIAASHRGARA